mgnify:CR=1 FL=1
MKLLKTQDVAAQADTGVLTVDNTVDVLSLDLSGVQRVDLQFPKFADGRAFSQAFMLRRRCGYTGALRATGDVLVDQLSQMQRCGFSSAVLRADQNLAKGRELLAHFSGFYQGDVTQPQPLFAR